MWTIPVDMIFSRKEMTVVVLGSTNTYQTMRGANSFKNVTENGGGNKQKIKGRSSKLLARRNECMTDRYYYYGAYTEKRYDAIIEQLSNEFFLSPVTVPDIIQNQMDYLQELKKQKISVYHFQQKWPHLKW